MGTTQLLVNLGMGIGTTMVVAVPAYFIPSRLDRNIQEQENASVNLTGHLVSVQTVHVQATKKEEAAVSA